MSDEKRNKVDKAVDDQGHWSSLGLTDVQPELEESNPLVDMVGLCVKTCPSFQKSEEGVGSTVSCLAKGGESPVVFRSVCMPWVQVLLDGLNRSQELLQAVNKQNAGLVAENKGLVEESVKIRSELGRYDAASGVWGKDRAELVEQVVEAKKARSDMWLKLKAVQQFTAEKKKMEERVAELEAVSVEVAGERDALSSRVVELETSSRDLRNREMHLGKINDDLERKAKKWTAMREQLQGQFAQFQASIEELEKANRAQQDLKKEATDGSGKAKGDE